MFFSFFYPCTYLFVCLFHFAFIGEYSAPAHRTRVTVEYLRQPQSELIHISQSQARPKLSSAGVSEARMRRW